MLREGAFTACNAAVAVGESHGDCRFSSLIFPPTGNFAAVWCRRPRKNHLRRVKSVASDESKSKPQDSSYLPGFANQLRLGSLDEEGLSYKDYFIVRCYEVGINKTATIQSIANLLQETSCNHYQTLGFSPDGFSTTPNMRKWNLIWVTTRMHIEMYQYPAWNDVVEIETWGDSEGIGMRRDWILKDYANDKVIGRATSKWVMINQDTRRFQKVPGEVHDEIMPFVASKALRFAFSEENNANMKKIPKLIDPAQYSKVGLVPRRADLDMNKHINNVTYLVWVLESMPQEIIDNHELHAITLDFRRECGQDDIVDSLTSPELAVDETISGLHGSASLENGCLQFLHRLRLSKDKSEINRGRTVWRKKPVKR